VVAPDPVVSPQVIGVFYVKLRRRHVRSNADLFVDGMRGYWASSAPRTQL